MHMVGAHVCSAAAAGMRAEIWEAGERGMRDLAIAGVVYVVLSVNEQYIKREHADGEGM
jgi:hypothetical protein